MRKSIIIGLDPGTTIAYAILDLKGNLIELKSTKQLSLNKLISETIKLYNILVVGTDRNKVPEFVEKFTSRVGAKMIKPNHNLLLKEKRKLVKNFIKENNYKIKTANKHQRDALASAIYSYKRLKQLFIEIENSVDIDDADKIKKIVLLKDFPIKKAIELKDSLKWF